MKKRRLAAQQHAEAALERMGDDKSQLVTIQDCIRAG